jgi:hypothetical protein
MTITITGSGAPKLNAVQLAALRGEQQRIDETYPDHDVAYLDEWDGDVLRRTVVAASRDLAEFQQLLKALDPVVRRKVSLTRVPPAGVIFLPPRVVV